MGLYDEFKLTQPNLTIESFIRDEQQKFVNYLLSLSGTGKVFVSDGAQKIFSDPVKDVQFVKSLPIGAIYYAYGVSKENVSLSEFKTKIECLLVV